jgi:hypothetical protein
MSARAILMALSLCLLNGGTARGAEPLILTVSPRIAPAPGFVRVSARIEPDADNRTLEITASSDGYTRTSEIQLNGLRAPRLSIVEYPDLPSGVYQVSAVLVGTRGRRAGMSRYVQVMEMPGRR